MLNPFPSSTTHRPCRFALTAVYNFPGEEFARIHAVCFHDCYGARVWLEMMIGNEPMTRRGHELHLDSGIKVRSFELQKILDYQFKDDEAKYHLPMEYVKWIARFRRGTWDDPKEPIITEAKVTVKTKTVIKQEEAPQGYVSVADLCKGTAVKPMNARALLRASKYVKPIYGWSFGPKDLPAVKKLIGV